MISFRSLLDGSDTISIDTEMVSSQEFLCLLDMVYTGKLPLGKHNVSRIIAAADSLQMFDVAVGFKNILTCLVNQQPSSQDINKHTAAAANLTGVKAGSVTAVCSSPASQEQLSTDRSQGATPLKKEDCCVDGEDVQERMCGTACEDVPESSGQSQLFSRALVTRASWLQMNALMSSSSGHYVGVYAA